MAEELKRWSVIAKVKEFNNEEIHYPGQKAKLTIQKEYGQMYIFEALYSDVYANGENYASEGHVSILIKMISAFPFLYNGDFDFTCIVSLIDAGMSTHFTKTYSFKIDISDVRKKYVVYRIGQYIERNNLLAESSNLLPSNCLTLHIDMMVQSFNPACNHLFELLVDVKLCIMEEKLRDGKAFYLNLDSAVARRFCELSIGLKEKLNRTNESTVYITTDQNVFRAFRQMCLIIMDAKYLTFETMGDICQVHKLVYGHDIQPAVETCRKLVNSYICRKKANFVYRETRIIKEAADVCEDKVLNEIIENILQENERYLQYLSHLEWECRLFSMGPIWFSPKDPPTPTNDEIGHEIQFRYKETAEGAKIRKEFLLSSNSTFGQRLCELSSVFKDMLDLTSESTLDIPIAAQEFPAFRIFFRMIAGPQYLVFRSVKDICQVYMLADKYDIQPVFETCRELLKSWIIRKRTAFLVREAEKILEALEMCDVRYTEEIAKCIMQENVTYFKDIPEQEWECEISKSGHIHFLCTPKDIPGEFHFYT